MGVSSKSWGGLTAIVPATVCVLGVGSLTYGAVVSIYSCTCGVARRSVPSTASVVALLSTGTQLVSFVWCFMCTLELFLEAVSHDYIRRTRMPSEHSQIHRIQFHQDTPEESYY